MSKRDFQVLATAMGDMLSLARWHGGEQARTQAYDTVLAPLTSYIGKHYPSFDLRRFMAAVEAREHSREGEAV